MMTSQAKHGWFLVSAFNAQREYGYGSETEAEKYCQLKNKDREINLWSAELIEDGQLISDLENKRDDGFNFADALAMAKCDE